MVNPGSGCEKTLCLRLNGGEQVSFVFNTAKFTRQSHKTPRNDPRALPPPTRWVGLRWWNWPRSWRRWGNPDFEIFRFVVFGIFLFGIDIKKNVSVFLELLPSSHGVETPWLASNLAWRFSPHWCVGFLFFVCDRPSFLLPSRSSCLRSPHTAHHTDIHTQTQHWVIGHSPGALCPCTNSFLLRKRREWRKIDHVQGEDLLYDILYAC